MMISIRARTLRVFALLLLLAILCFYLIAPDYIGWKLRRAFVWISGMGVDRTQKSPVSSSREARFANIDGYVRVKQERSDEWIPGDYSTRLQKGDFVQTGRDGLARIIFADGTNYTLKPDSLIVVEESADDPVTRATRVAVQVTSGTVDLSTGNFSVPGSTSQVSFAGAVASLGEKSRAVVRNDPAENMHEFTVGQGQADVRRGPNILRLGQYERVTFDAKAPGLNRQKVVAPPALLAPADMDTLTSHEPKTMPVRFSWSNVPEAVAYHLQVSSSAIFLKLAADKKIEAGTSAQVSGLDEGTYYWSVSSVDGKGVESPPSTANQFSLVQPVNPRGKVFLEVTRVIQHDKVLEVVGQTEPGSWVIINHEQVFSVAPDGTFRLFTSLLPKPGSSEVTITARNRKGGTRTMHKTIVFD